MIYYRQRIDSFIETFEKCSVIVLLGENYSLLQKDAKKISDALAGNTANEEMRVNKYFNQEINEKRNEITRYSVTLDVKYRLYNKKTNKVIIKNKVSATSDYSAAVTFTGFATEIARKDTYERLADTVAEKMITEIVISNLSEYSP